MRRSGKYIQLHTHKLCVGYTATQLIKTNFYMTAEDEVQSLLYIVSNRSGSDRYITDRL